MSKIVKGYNTIEQHADILTETIKSSKDAKLPDIPVSSMKNNIDDELLSNLRNVSKKECKVIISRLNANKFMEAVNERVIELRNKIVKKMDIVQTETTKFLSESENNAKKDSHKLKTIYMENKSNLNKTNDETLKSIKRVFLRDVNNNVDKLKTLTSTFTNINNVNEVDNLIEKMSDLTNKFKNDLIFISNDYRKKIESQKKQFNELINKMENTYEKELKSILTEANNKHDKMKNEKEHARKQLEDLYKQKIKEEVDVADSELKVTYWSGGGYFSSKGEYVDGRIVQALPARSSIRIVVGIDGTYKTIEVKLDDLCIED